jgi:hypothetical protein
VCYFLFYFENDQKCYLHKNFHPKDKNKYSVKTDSFSDNAFSEIIDISDLEAVANHCKVMFHAFTQK